VFLVTFLSPYYSLSSPISSTSFSFSFSVPSFTSGGAAQEIPFRNCFASQCIWTYSTDSPSFRLALPQATLGPKVQGLCSITFDPQGEVLNTPGGVIAAKLFISCTSKPDVPPWVFYLRGNMAAPGDVLLSPRKGGKKQAGMA
jgi:hypothetical protein